MSFKKTFIAIFTILITFPSLALAADIPSFFGFDTSSPQAWINSIYRYGISLGALLALAGLVYGGFRYLTSAGNEEAVTSGKQAIFAALTGLVIMLFSHMILKQLDPRLVELRLSIPEVDLPDNTASNLSHGGVNSTCNILNRSEEQRSNCSEGLLCVIIDSGSTIGRCSDKNLNSPCNPDSANACRGAGLQCNRDRLICLREGEEPDEGPRENGAHCSGNDQCQSGICYTPSINICVNGTDSDCSTSNNCQDTHYCQDYRELADPHGTRHCRSKKAVGGTCYQDNHCISGDCSGSVRIEGNCR